MKNSIELIILAFFRCRSNVTKTLNTSIYFTRQLIENNCLSLINIYPSYPFSRNVMLEILCVSSLALSVNVNSCPELPDSILIKQIEISQVVTTDVDASYMFLAKGRPYKSRYREEADRYREDHERNYEEVNGVEVQDGRIYRDADHYRRQSDYRDERLRNDRIYRDTNYHRQESESERDRNSDSRYDQRERYRDGYIRRSRY